MDASFWHQRWQSNQLGFHQNAPNRMLVGHVAALSLDPGATVFLPLCGKTKDIGWLLSQGFRVVGAELSEVAIEQLFVDLGVEPSCAPKGDLVHYSAANIDVFVGDIFSLTPEAAGPVDAVYDRAALIALPAEMRSRYAEHLVALTGRAPQLLVCCEYDQTEMPGPPFSVDTDEIKRCYQAHYAITLLESADVPGGLKGICKADETAWLLR